MADFVRQLPHLIIAVVVIAATSVLAAIKIIDPGTAVALIGAAGGFSLGGAVASSSPTAAIATGPAAVTSTSPSAGATVASVSNATPVPVATTTTG